MPKIEDMTKSYEKINYSIRPAKCMERKMLCETFRRLSPFGEVKKYRYVGFGSPFFCDFYLFHKMLSIKNMICIEKYIDDKKRFEFNKPFSCIKMKYGDSNDILPVLEWDIRTIIWLDYDLTLDETILEDIKHVFTSAGVGSVIIITVDGNVRDENGDKLEEKEGMQQLRKNVGKEKVPIDISEKDLHGWKTLKVFRKIINNEMLETVKDRNGGRSPRNKLIYKQLFNFHYSDETRMLTVGGILFDEGTREQFNKCNFKKLDFIRSSEEPYLILVPKLTFREIKVLDKYLPSNFRNSPRFIPEDHRKMYKNVYRHFPHFAETIL